jgi:hypothetical protein
MGIWATVEILDGDKWRKMSRGKCEVAAAELVAMYENAGWVARVVTKPRKA